MPSRATRITAAVLFAVVVLLALELMTSPRAEAMPAAPTAAAALESGPALLSTGTASAGAEEIDTSDAVDSYGNEVTRAVATYKFDATGSLYELHSPRTEVPRLAAPKS